MKSKYTLLVILAASLMFVYSCKDEEPEPKSGGTTVDCAGETPTYNGIIAALINANCTNPGCHGNGSAQAGISLTNYAEVKAVAQGDKFFKAIKHEDGAEPMPKNGVKFSDKNIKSFECWKQNGYPES